MKIPIYKSEDNNEKKPLNVVKKKSQPRKPKTKKLNLGNFKEEGHFLVSNLNGSEIKIDKESFEIIFTNGMKIKASSIEDAIEKVKTMCS